MIAKQVQDILDLFIRNASVLANLSVPSLLSLFCLILLAVIVYDKREAQKKDRAWQDIRALDAVSDTKAADAQRVMADKLSELVTIINERLPRRSA